MTDFSADDLATIYPAPSPRVIAKARPEVDVHAKKFIGMSPFCVLATSASDGSVDASPRGGNPGFIHVAGPNLLLMPDRWATTASTVFATSSRDQASCS